MSKHWLIIDSNFLCHRAFYSLGSLQYGDMATGVLFGFFKGVFSLQERFATNDIVFCFDYGKGKRKNFFPDYKRKRHKKELTEEEIELQIEFRKQVSLLRDSILPRLGYRNIFFQEGYESDDVMASICNHLSGDDTATIVTADADLLQCVRGHIDFFNPTKAQRTTYQSFKKEWGIRAEHFWRVKALAGCKTDEVPGIKGVGEKTAVKYLRKELKKTSAVYKKIVSEDGLAIRKRNIRLVRLPYPGTKVFRLHEDQLDDAEWGIVAEEYGFTSMKGKRRNRRQRGFNL